MLQPLKLIVQEIKSSTVHAKTADGQTWQFEKTAIAGTPTVGQEIRVIAFAPGNEEAGKTAFAHQLLNEILSPSSS